MSGSAPTSSSASGVPSAPSAGMLSELLAHGAEVADLCRRFGVERLEVFGSAVRDDFDPASSDIDFLVEFGSGAEVTGLDAYFGFKEGLEELFGRSVDLIAPRSLENPFFAATVNEHRELLYAA